MKSSVKGEVHLYVPFQIIHDRSDAADLFYEQGMVGEIIGEHVPMSGRCFGVGTIRPELSEDARVITALDHVGRIRLAGDRIVGVTVSVKDVEVASAVVTHVIEA